MTSARLVRHDFAVTSCMRLFISYKNIDLIVSTFYEAWNASSSYSFEIDHLHTRASRLRSLVPIHGAMCIDTESEWLSVLPYL